MDALIKTEQMLKGVYHIIHTKCGKPNCWCVEGGGHRHERLTWREANKGHNRAIPLDDIDWVKEMTANYHSFKQLRQDLFDKQREMNIAIDALRDEIIYQTKRGQSYLNIEE